MKNNDNEHVLGRRNFFKAGLAGAAIAALPACDEKSSEALSPCGFVEVDTAKGRLRGKQVGNIFEFRGVRYAEPQTAANRFKAPIPLKPWSGTRDALENGFMAMQSPSRGGLWVLSFRDYGKKSEDCLTLNVYTPSIKSDKKRAVMFWCHGGGFATGSGNVPVYDGKSLADHGDVVVVTVNHRLNVFGYLALEELGGSDYSASGNAGMLDIVEALGWVRDNIETFGGDPNNVTIFGESGGGAKVSMLLAMPAAKGLFHKAIVQSGSSNDQNEQADATEYATKFLASIGLDGSQLNKLHEMSAVDLMKAAGPMLRRFGPHVDGVHIARDSFTPDANPLTAGIPMMIGTCKTEATTFANDMMFSLDEAGAKGMLGRMFGAESASLYDAYKVNHPDLSPSHLYFYLASDMMFRQGAITQAERKVAQGLDPVFMYKLSYESPVDGGKWLTPHAMDLPLMFRNQHLEQMVDVIGEGPDQDKVADAMSSAWIAFAKTGNPSNSVTGQWDAYDIESRKTMIFDVESKVVSDPDKADRELFMAAKPFRIM
jgi:para-nitrobenzyl esterase